MEVPPNPNAGLEVAVLWPPNAPNPENDIVIILFYNKIKYFFDRTKKKKWIRGPRSHECATNVCALHVTSDCKLDWHLLMLFWRSYFECIKWFSDFKQNTTRKSKEGALTGHCWRKSESLFFHYFFRTYSLQHYTYFTSVYVRTRTCDASTVDRTVPARRAAGTRTLILRRGIRYWD